MNISDVHLFFMVKFIQIYTCYKSMIELISVGVQFITFFFSSYGLTYYMLTHWSLEEVSVISKCLIIKHNSVIDMLNILFIPHWLKVNISSDYCGGDFRQQVITSVCVDKDIQHHIDSSVQEYSISIANALEILQCYTKPTIWCY